MNLPKPGTFNYNELSTKIETGNLRIPQFQRDFVWDKRQSAKLIDSLLKGFPIGTFILWKTKDQLRSIKNIGGQVFPLKEEGDYVQYILDGQQRITSVYAAIKGVVIEKDGKNIDYSDIFVNLDAKIDEEIVFAELDAIENNVTHIKLTKLLDLSISEIAKYDSKYHDTIDLYRKKIASYLFAKIEVEEVAIDVATEIFTRLNVGGKDLSAFEIMVAKTYDEHRKFDLSQEYDSLIEKLEEIGYETIPNSTLMQAVAVCIVGECSKKQILKIDKNKFIDIFADVKAAVESTIDYFRNYFRIPVSQLLPYDGLIVPFSYFFYKNKDKPTGIKQKYLQDYFWRTVLNERFSNSMETKVGQDIKKMDLILKEELPKYEEGVDVTIETFKRKGWFATGKAYIKGMLCILAHEQPESFIDGSLVNIDNSWLKQANSKNYHHFFPKAYLNKMGHEEFYINHIANITIVDDFINKRKIKDKAPSRYMKQFENDNSELQKSMDTHLITDVLKFGIWDDNYDKFFNERCKAFCEKLEKKIVKTPVDIFEKL